MTMNHEAITSQIKVYEDAIRDLPKDANSVQIKDTTNFVMRGVNSLRSSLGKNVILYRSKLRGVLDALAIKIFECGR